MRRGKSGGKFLHRAGPHGTHDFGAVLHRCVGVEGCGACPQGIRRTAFAPTRPSLVVTYLRFGVPASGCFPCTIPTGRMCLSIVARASKTPRSRLTLNGPASAGT
jgi:hypothetical protein